MSHRLCDIFLKGKVNLLGRFLKMIEIRHGYNYSIITSSPCKRGFGMCVLSSSKGSCKIMKETTGLCFTLESLSLFLTELGTKARVCHQPLGNHVKSINTPPSIAEGTALPAPTLPRRWSKDELNRSSRRQRLNPTPLVAGKSANTVWETNTRAQTLPELPEH